MVEPEIAFAHLEDAIVLAQDLVCAVVARVLETRREELMTLERDTAKLENVRAPFPRLHYDDAIELIRSKGSETQWGSDFGGTDETVIAEAHDRPVVVHRFPAKIKAFYMQPDAERPELSLSADILAPEGYGEIVGGGERISDPELLLKRIHEHDLPEEAFRWYVDLRRFGTVPHAGFGMGIERLVTWICGIEHLRETIAFPRMLYRIYP
jgi:asparaginyl-tRNA synthetase